MGGELQNCQDLIKKSLGDECLNSIEGALSPKPRQLRQREAEAQAVKSKKRELLPLTGMTLISTMQELVREAVQMSIKAVEKEEYEVWSQGLQ